MSLPDPANRLHRSIKLALDSGEASSYEMAHQIFSQYQVALEIGPNVAQSATLQAAVLTVVNVARRCFLGGVNVSGYTDFPLTTPGWRGERLSTAIARHGGLFTSSTPSNVPRIIIGNELPGVIRSGIAIRGTFDGWLAAVAPLGAGLQLPESQECPLAGVLIGGLAVTEAFLHVRGQANAGRRIVKFNLWSPEALSMARMLSDLGPGLERLPSKLWMIGLGHLGQAVLWTLGFLPYERPYEMAIVLQDYEELVEANASTGLLTFANNLGQMKTRAMAMWCEQRGFSTRIVERPFAENFRIDPDEPQVAVCGVDNAEARAALEGVGFQRIVEAGLGHGIDDYLAFQVHIFPAEKTARIRWKSGGASRSLNNGPIPPAYRRMLEEGLDECGVTLLSGRAVGAPFVGTVVATFIVAELVRLAYGGHRYEVIDGDLRNLAKRQVITTREATLPFNPGITAGYV